MNDNRQDVQFKTRALVSSPRLFSKYCLKVPVKADSEPSSTESASPLGLHDSGEVSLIYNPAQLLLYEHFMSMMRDFGYVALDIVKARQVGSSTLWLSIMYHGLTFRKNFIANLICDRTKTTAFLNNRLDKFWNGTPPQFRRVKVPAFGADFKFNNGAEYYSMTAGTTTSGRGGTPRFIIGSEVAHFPNYEEIHNGLFEAITLKRDSGNVSIRESTSNGEGTGWHDHVLKSARGETEYQVAFVSWLLDSNCIYDVPTDFRPTREEEDLMRVFPAMTPGHVMFRRRKLASRSLAKFKQEYPLTLEESFEGSGEKFFPSVLVNAALGTSISDTRAPVLIGGDSARTNDRAVVAVRRGREVLELNAYNEMDEITFAMHIAKKLNRYSGSKAFLDPMYAWGSIDYLVLHGFEDRVVPVYFNGRAFEDQVYYNRRSEMFHRLLEWLKNPPVSLPNLPGVKEDFAVLPEPVEKNGKWLFPPKKEIKKLLGKSTDILDALALTFADDVDTESTPVKLLAPDGSVLSTGTGVPTSGFKTKDYLRKFNKSDSRPQASRLFNVHKY